MVEENQEMEMEEILSSIKDILESDEQTTDSSAEVATENLIDDTADLLQEDDDVLELSPDMRIDDILQSEEPNADENINENISLTDDVSLEINDEITMPEENASSDDVALTDDLSDTALFDNIDFSQDAISSELDEALPEISDEEFNIETFENTNEDDEVGSLEEELAEEISSIDQDADINVADLDVQSELVEDIVAEPKIEESILEDFNIDEPVVEEVSSFEDDFNIETPLIEENVTEPMPKEYNTNILAEPEIQTSEQVADISANIISNFAKMFSREEKVKPAEVKTIQEDIKPMVGNKSLEDFVFEIIKNGITNEMNKQLNSSEFAELIKSEVKRQIAAWINENLPTTVEKVVKREIEKVVAKAGV